MVNLTPLIEIAPQLVFIIVFFGLIGALSDWAISQFKKLSHR